MVLRVTVAMGEAPFVLCQSTASGDGLGVTAPYGGHGAGSVGEAVRVDWKRLLAVSGDGEQQRLSLPLGLP
jgi:hypothetical protein